MNRKEKKTVNCKTEKAFGRATSGSDYIAFIAKEIWVNLYY